MVILPMFKLSYFMNGKPTCLPVFKMNSDFLTVPQSRREFPTALLLNTAIRPLLSFHYSLKFMESEQLSSVYLPSTKQQTEKVVEESLLYGQKHDSRVALCALQISVQTEIDSEKLHGNTLNAVNTSTLMPFSLCMVRLHMTCFR